MAKLSIDDCAAARSPGRVIRRVDKLMSMWVESRLPAGEISLTQWIALKAVRDGTANNPGEVARELGHTTGAVTRLIDGLEQRGLVERDRAGADRRVVSLKITEAGSAKLYALAPAVVDSWNEVIAEFDQEEVDRFFTSLRKLLAVVESKTADALREELTA